MERKMEGWREGVTEKDEKREGKILHLLIHFLQPAMGKGPSKEASGSLIGWQPPSYFNYQPII